MLRASFDYWQIRHAYVYHSFIFIFGNDLRHCFSSDWHISEIQLFCPTILNLPTATSSSSHNSINSDSLQKVKSLQYLIKSKKKRKFSLFKNKFYFMYVNLKIATLLQQQFKIACNHSAYRVYFLVCTIFYWKLNGFPGCSMSL